MKKMKKHFLLFLSLVLFLLTFSCKKYNPEDPWFSNFKHMNERLDGEWELVKFYINDSDSSAYLDIDTMNVAKFFKFVPTKEINSVEGEGELYIKSKSMNSYPDLIGACPSTWAFQNDTTKALVKLKYRFREGTLEGNSYFSIDYDVEQEVAAFNSNIFLFKPLKYTNRVFNNFYYRPIFPFAIRKCTKNSLIIQHENLTANLDDLNSDKKYRYEFKKIN